MPLEQRDCGKPTKQARADVVALARYFEFYAGACDKLHGDTIPYLDGYSVMTWREAHGVTGHVIPWNYPMQIFGRSVGGALAAGNVCVVKPAEDACLSLIRVAQLAQEAGFPPGALNIVTGYGHEVGDALARHPGIDHISFTGSPSVGTLIQQVAAVRHCPVTLELGGKSPQIVFADADLCCAPCPFEMKTRRWHWPMPRNSDWRPVSGLPTARASSVWRGVCAAARCLSTTTALAAAWSCPLVVSSRRDTGAKKALKRCSVSPRSRRLPSNTAPKSAITFHPIIQLAN